MSNLKMDQTLLEENIDLKRHQKEMNQNFLDLLSMIKDSIVQMNQSLIELKNKPCDQDTVMSRSSTNFEDMTEKEIDAPKPFIPSSDVSGMNVNVSPIEKRKRKANLFGAADQLTKLQREND